MSEAGLAGPRRGLHRSFCLWSLASRGTAEAPGLVLALTPGGSCRGVAFRLPAPAAIDELHLLWRREMVVGSYNPKWVKLDVDGKPVTGLAFTVKRDHPQYAGKLSVEQQANVIGSACGHLGTSQDYLERTRVAYVGRAARHRRRDEARLRRGGEPRPRRGLRRRSHERLRTGRRAEGRP